MKRLPKLVAPKWCDTPGKVAVCIRRMCRSHVKKLTGDEDSRWHQHVHRIFFYDALPYDGKEHHPIDNRPIDYAKSHVAHERRELFDHLRKERKVALRLGKVNREHSGWTINPTLTKKLLRTRQALEILDQLGSADQAEAGKAVLRLSAEEAIALIAVRDIWRGLNGSDVRLGLRQKGVDMRIGIDIASITLKKQADTIILVAGDSDFVPAAKMARREGMEFILDPLWQKVNADLFEHIDGLQSGLPKPDSGHPPETGETAKTNTGG